MKKVTVKKAVRYTEEGARQEAVFTGTNESAGYVAGWSGDYLAVRVNGEKERFSTLKAAKEFLAAQPSEKAAEEMSIKEYVEKFGKSFTMTKAEMGC